MSKVRALLALLAALLGSAVLLAPPAQAATVSTTLRSGIAGLPVATEVRTGYSRDKFQLWIDADGERPSFAEARRRLERLRRDGPNREVFTPRWVRAAQV